MTEGIGVDGIHCVSRTCDLCGDACDANTQELNVLSCTFAKCEDLCYHQDCLEKYLKSIRLERNRKTGFKCPRGCGKSSAYKDPCPGKIDKSHPIHPRNEEQKKKKKAKVPEIAALVATRPKTKEEKKAERAAAAAKTQAATAAADKGKAAKQPVAGSLKAGGVSTAQPAVNTVKARPPLPPDPKKQLAEALAAARRELAAGKQSREPTPTQTAAAPAAPEYKTLDMYYKENAASSSNLSSISSAATAAAAAPVANAWAKPPVPAAAAVRHKATAAAEAQHASSSKLAAAGHAAPAAVVHSVSNAVKQGIQLQRADAAAAAAAAGQPPPPPPPPPPPDQHHGLVAARIGSGVHSAAAAGSSSGAAAANGHLPIGMEYLAEEDQQHLTKAQRKNLKRAEKKKKKEESVGNAAAGSPNAQPEASGHTDSAAGPTAASTSGNAAASSSNWASTSPSQVDAAAAATAGSSSVAATAADDLADDAESSALLYELAVQALLAHRTLELVASLQRLGFTDWQAAAAVQRHGSDIEVAVAWLLDGGAPDAAAAASVGMGCVAHVDIADDLALMEQLAAALPQIPKPRLYQAVADTAGDLDAAAAVCLQQATMSDSQQSAAEEVPAAAAETSSYAFGLVPAAPDASMQQYASGDCNRVDSSSLFASSSFYSNAPLTAAAGVGALSPRGDAVYNGWLEDSSLGLSSLQQQQQQHLLPGNDSSHLRNTTNMPTSSSGFNHLGSTHTAAVAGPGLGNSIWATDNNVAGQAGISSIWGTAGAGGSLFGIGSSGNGLYGLDNAFGSILQNGPVTNSGDLLSGSGLGFVEAAGSGLNLQESLSAADPVLESFGSGNVFGLNNAATAATAAGGGGNAAAAAGGSAGVSAALQGSRLFQAYGWRQQPLFGEQQQGMQQQGSSLAVAAAVNGPVSGDVDEPDLEGLMATLMCH